MVSNQTLFSVGNFDFRIQHLLIIGVLILSFSISMIIRSGPLAYGFELFEFDTFFNLRATEYVLDNGVDSYLHWIDEKSWHPFGRNVSETSQVSLHLATAYFYQIFGFSTPLYDFAVLFPMIIGSLTAIVVFAFVRVLGGTTAGLLAALIFSVSVPIFTRGLAGWLKSEPLGLFLGILAMYLFVSGIKFNKGKISFIKLILAGLFLSLGLSAWGGILFFVLGVAIFNFALPFVKNEKSFLLWATPTFAISLTLFSLLFERTTSFVIGYAGVAIMLPTIFVIITEFIKKVSNEKNRIRNSALCLISICVAGITIFITQIVSLPSFRYQNAVNPFLITQDALTDSVAEHQTTTMDLSFTLLSFFIVLSVIGIWFLFSRKTIELKLDMRAYALIVGLIAIYVSSAFVRLELFASIGVIILGSIGLSILISKMYQQNDKRILKLIFSGIIIALFIIPVSLPEGRAWIDWSDFSPTILSGGSIYTDLSTNDWHESMMWLKQNTPEDAIIASWWDYGYWITTLGERTTLIDNSTLIDWQITKMAYSLITTPDNSWNILNSHYSEDISEYLGDERIIALGGRSMEDHHLNVQSHEMFKKEFNQLTGEEKNLVTEKINQNGPPTCKQVFKAEAYSLGVDENSCNPIAKGMNADYVLTYIVGERFYVDGSNVPLYTLEGGGDESKKTWFTKISGHQVSKFIQDDNITPTDYFMENSTLGQLMPYSIVKYVQPNTGKTFDEYYSGFIPVYVNNLKFSDPENDPYILVYASPSYYSQQPGKMSTVLIYKINPDYSG
tara:strand:+ start:493 stop:2847 length:2355 start_codon:yes stop_codon:yes gene_type:complete